MALEKQGNRESALNYYTKALEVRPDYEPARKNKQRLEKLLQQEGGGSATG